MDGEREREREREAHWDYLCEFVCQCDAEFQLSIDQRSCHGVTQMQGHHETAKKHRKDIENVRENVRHTMREYRKDRKCEREIRQNMREHRRAKDSLLEKHAGII